MSHQALPVLRTPRLTLRPLDPKDTDALVEGVGNYDVSRWLSVVPYPYTREDADWFIEKTLTDRSVVWAICDDTGLKGCIGIDPELGYWLARPVWRMGYAFEAAIAVLDYWFGEAGKAELRASFFETNERSGAVLKALGFMITGQGVRDARALSQTVTSLEMVLTRERWEARADFTIYTPRLTLRPWKSGDATELLGLITPGLTRGVSSIPNDWTLADAEAALEARQWRGHLGFILAIEHKGQLIGGVGCGGQPLSLMYYIAESYWNQGFATEAASAFLPELFKRFPINTLAADHFEDNPASGHVLRKLGFVETGKGLATSKGRLEPAPVITYAVTRDTFRIAS